jgi:hypothetical protein
MPGDEKPNNDNKEANAGDMVSKADLEAAQAENAKMKQDLEDMRLEVFSPTYMAFLDAKDKPKSEPAKEPLKEEDLSKLSPKELMARAKAEAKQELQAEIDKAKNDAVSTVSKEQSQKEVAAFARTHADFETFRPVMYGLSLDPKNKDLSLPELFDAAKAYVKRVAGPSEEEQTRQKKLASEKPGGDSESFEKYRKMSPEATAKEALEEVKGKLGPIPSA